MTISEKIAQRLYVAAVGTVATIVTQKLLVLAWRAATGQEPPKPGDPEAPWAAILTWTAASSVGIAATQLFTRRLTLRHLLRSAQEAVD